jgi:hypothetical protein
MAWLKLPGLRKPLAVYCTLVILALIDSPAAFVLRRRKHVVILAKRRLGLGANSITAPASSVPPSCATSGNLPGRALTGTAEQGHARLLHCRGPSGLKPALSEVGELRAVRRLDRRRAPRRSKRVPARGSSSAAPGLRLPLGAQTRVISRARVLLSLPADLPLRSSDGSHTSRATASIPFNCSGLSLRGCLLTPSRHREHPRPGIR